MVLDIFGTITYNVIALHNRRSENEHINDFVYDNQWHM